MADLEARLIAQPGIRSASTFVSLAEAEAGVKAVFLQRAEDISNWVSGGAQGRMVLEGTFQGGQILSRGATATTGGKGVRVILEGTGGGAWRIVTGFPVR